MGQNFWDNNWSKFEPFNLDPALFRETIGLSDRVFVELIGDVSGKKVLELGCGNGLLSVYLAKMGAWVTAVDSSIVGIQNTQALADSSYVHSKIKAHSIDALNLMTLNESFDIIVGRFVLHHIEPFDHFADILFNIMKVGGRGVFRENSSRNQILRLFRTVAPGRFGIPKYSDDKEYPLQVEEIEMLRQKFDKVEIHYTEFKFLRMVNEYLLRHNRQNLFTNMDDWIYNHCPRLHKYSYTQIIEIKK